MKEQERIFSLSISNNVPEKDFIKRYGKELFDKIQAESFAIDRGRCAACGHNPPEGKLYLHIPTESVNDKNPEQTRGISLCKMCHMTQHIESAIKKKWILFVNSTTDQNNIVRLTRANQIYGALNQRTIVQLKKTPEQFLKEWYAGEVRLTPTLKVIFTNDFVIDDL